MKDAYRDHILAFDAKDCNDTDWNTIINVLKENLPNFQVLYGDGNWMNFRWDDTKRDK